MPLNDNKLIKLIKLIILIIFNRATHQRTNRHHAPASSVSRSFFLRLDNDDDDDDDDDDLYSTLLRKGVRIR